MTLDEARDHIGDWVTYHRHPGCDCGGEDGVITRVSGSWVFVRYAGDRSSKATDPADLTLIAGKVPGDG